jgi:predicted RNase H-like HicB family nuclease
VMKYIFTSHAKQRRPHFPVKTDEELNAIMDYLDTAYVFSTLEDGKYSFMRKGKAAVFLKDSNQITLITIRGISVSTVFDAESIPTLKKNEPEADELKARRKEARNKKNKWMQYYPGVFEETKGNGYSVFFPDVPGCISAGNNLEEAINMSKKAIAVHLTEMIKDGDLLPKVNLGRCREVAKGHIIVMVRPQRELLIVKKEK